MRTRRLRNLAAGTAAQIQRLDDTKFAKNGGVVSGDTTFNGKLGVGVSSAEIPSSLFVQSGEPSAIFKLADVDQLEGYHFAFGWADNTKYHRIRTAGGSNDGFSIDLINNAASMSMLPSYGIDFRTNDGVSSKVAMRVDTSQNMAVGNSTTVPTAALAVNSTSKGFLPPRMTSSQAGAIDGAAEGLMVYVTDTGAPPFTTKGWFGYDGTAWKRLSLDA